MTSKNGAAAPTQQQFHQAITLNADAWYSACLRITRNEALAQDAVQEALLNAWKKRHQFHGNAALATWIHRIATNCALTLLRKHRKMVWTELSDEIADETANAGAFSVMSELEHDLEIAMGELSELERICFVLKHIEEWRLREIAEELNIGVGPVKQALFRGIGKLRRSMVNLKGAT